MKNDLPAIDYVQRSRDWMAFVIDHPEIWECGKTDWEAVGKLVIRLGDVLEKSKGEQNKPHEIPS